MSPSADGITLMADKVPVHRAQPGRCGRWRAVQITHSIDAQEGDPGTTHGRLRPPHGDSGVVG
jgi:flagellar motor switch protein FliM